MACTSHGCNGACWEFAARRLGASSCGMQKEGVSGPAVHNEAHSERRRLRRVFSKLGRDLLCTFSFLFQRHNLLRSLLSQVLVQLYTSGGVAPVRGVKGYGLLITCKDQKPCDRLRSLGLSEFLIYLPDACLRQLMNRGTRIGEKSNK